MAERAQGIADPAGCRVLLMQDDQHRSQRLRARLAPSGEGYDIASGADLTFATLLAKNSRSERQIQSSTRINILLVVL
jgi:hypothetical protein